MEEEVNNPLLQLIEDTFNRSTAKDLEDHYLKTTQGLKKWTCYTDYCFDDKNKPNDTFTVTLIPYIDNFDSLTQLIRSAAPTDIKHTQQVRDAFMTFLKQYPLINFSFILNDRKKIIGKDHVEVKRLLKQTFTMMREQYLHWGKNQPAQKAHYDSVIKKIEDVIRSVDADKKIKQIVDMVLVTFFSAYVSSRIIKNNTIETFGWFSDRDALNEVSDHLSADLFQYYLHGLGGGHDFKFVFAPAGSISNAYYEELVRIPDYLAGALADYNNQENTVSKEKFNTILTNYMADNIHNNFVYRLFVHEHNLSCTRVQILKKDVL